jgi:hypothetical protein
MDVHISLQWYLFDIIEISIFLYRFGPWKVRITFFFRDEGSVKEKL